jgi:peroxiredoxin family protein
MTPETDGSSPDKLSLIVFSDDFERVHYAFATAAAAAAVDRPTTLFLTMGAIRALAQERSDGAPGWMALRGASRDADFAKRGVATFEELVDACVALGVRILVCEMGLRVLGLERGELRRDVRFEEGGIVTFLNDASATGAMLFV